MSKVFASLICVVALAHAQNPAATKSTTAKALKKAPAAKSTNAPQPVTITKDAVANNNGTYAWTDKEGKKWIFVNTPFGVMKSAANDDSGQPSLDGVKAFDAGDKVRFEKASPFGPVKWEKNKSDLTDAERSLLASQNKQN